MVEKERAMLLWMLECPPEIEDEWNEWYNLEHFANLIRVPGFINGNRYVRLQEMPLAPGTSSDPVPKYLTFYELQERKVLESEAYFINRASNAPGMRPHWNKRMASLVSRVVGGPYYLHSGTWFTAEDPAPQTLWVCGFDPGTAGPAALDAWLTNDLLPSLQDCDGVVATRVMGAFKDAPPVSSKNSKRGWSRIVLCSVSDSSVPKRAEELIGPALSVGAQTYANATAITYERMRRCRHVQAVCSR